MWRSTILYHFLVWFQVTLKTAILPISIGSIVNCYFMSVLLCEYNKMPNSAAQNTPSTTPPKKKHDSGQETLRRSLFQFFCCCSAVMVCLWEVRGDWLVVASGWCSFFVALGESVLNIVVPLSNEIVFPNIAVLHDVACVWTVRWQ